jgi:hypothetical protein
LQFKYNSGAYSSKVFSEENVHPSKLLLLSKMKIIAKEKEEKNNE